MLYKNTAILLNTLVLFFTTFDHKAHSFTKKREDKFEELCVPEHVVLRAIITSLQYGIKSSEIWNTHTIVNHLKKNTKARDFVHLLRSLKTLESTDFVSINSTYFTEYRDLLISLVDSSESYTSVSTMDEIDGESFPPLPSTFLKKISLAPKISQPMCTTCDIPMLIDMEAGIFSCSLCGIALPAIIDSDDSTSKADFGQEFEYKRTNHFKEILEKQNQSSDEFDSEDTIKTATTGDLEIANTNLEATDTNDV